MDKLQWILPGVLVPVGLGLLAQIILPWYRAPKLMLVFKNCEPFCQKAPRSLSNPLLPNSNSFDGYWIRVQVKNKGQKTAKNIAGKLTEIRDAKYKIRPQTKPILLNWSIQEKLVSLRPGEKGVLDIAVIPDKLPLAIWISVAEKLPSVEWDLPQGTFYFEIEVYAEDAKPAKSLYRLEWKRDGIDQVRMKRLCWPQRCFVKIKSRIYNTIKANT